jgi:hypothetical protein
MLRPASAGLGLSLVVAASAAHAQGVDEFGAYGTPQERADFESPQHWLIALRLGPYYPEVDKEFEGTPYRPLAETLGTGSRVMFGIEGDWQALRLGKLASFGPGFGMGYTRLSGQATFTAPPNGVDYDGTQQPPAGTSPMDSTLKLWVQWAAAVASVDALDRELGIPLVFTVKLGLGHALWWASKGNLAGRSDDGSIGHGRSWGAMWALGAMFDLNFAQPERSKKLDAVSGINHMYLFGEWYQLKLNGFGSGDQMLVGDSTWAIGYAVDF